MSYAKSLFEIIEKEGLKSLISNIHTKVISYELEDGFILTTVTDAIQKNAYVVSPYSLMIDYGEDELIKIESKTIRTFYYLLIKSFSVFLKFTKIDMVQTLNNYLFSTNFFSKEWENINISALRKISIAAYPKHALLIRSINKIQNPKLHKRLRKDGWRAIIIRQVYIYDDHHKWQRCRNSKNDKKLLYSKRFTFEEANDFSTASRLYNALYLDKHSKHNIHYSAKFIEHLHQKSLLKLFFLKDHENEKYVGVVGLTQEGNIMTVPIIGYEMSYDKNHALYRRLAYKATSYAFENDCLLNFSSGAPDFKSKRGARAELEYMFVYDKHLSFKRRLAWQSLSLLSKYLYAPMLKKLKL